MPEQPQGTVTLLFSDIEGSTRLLQELGRERYAEALDLHRRMLREAFERHGGYEVDYEGDAFFVAFPAAERAAQAALEAQMALAAQDWPDGRELRVRIGIHTGEPLAQPPKYVGLDVHRAARIMAAGHGGQVLVSETTARLVEPEPALLDLGLHRLKDFEQPVRLYQLGPGEFPPLKSLNQSNLPLPATPFLGRERELAELLALLRRDDVRLLTLTGPGGTGKTRLALETASELVPDFADGVFWLSLAPLREPELVLEQLAQTLGAKGELATHIADKELLCLLDNFEQLLEAAPALGELLGRCSNLQLLVTSREPLHLAAEREYPVQPLELAEATALFRERALAVRPDFQANGAVEAICRRLDCLPLAVELAAPRIKVLSPEMLLERLEQRLPLLTGGARDAPERQRTLRATIAWSYDLLAVAEQRLLACLSVFVGGCTLEAAEEVAEADLDTLQSLVEKSLLREREGRFWMLETIREFAQERLEESGEGEQSRRRHAEHCLAAVVQTIPELDVVATSAPLDRLETENDNLRAALVWAQEADAELALEIAARLGRFWYMRGYISEGRHTLSMILAREHPPSPLLIKACQAAGNFAFNQGDYDEATSLFTRCIDLAKRLGETERLAVFIDSLGAVAMAEGDLRTARDLFTQALSSSRAEGFEKGAASALTNLGFVEVASGHPDLAADHLQEAITLFGRLGDLVWSAEALAGLAWARHTAGDRSEAQALLAQSIEISMRLRDRRSLVDRIGLFGLLCASSDPEGASRLLGAEQAARQELQLPPLFLEEEIRRQAITELDKCLDEATRERAFEAASALSLEEAVAYAMATLNEPSAVSTD